MFCRQSLAPRLLAALGLLGAITLANVPSRAAATSTPFTVVARGLDNPRGLAFGPNGALYVSNYGVMAGQGQVIRIAH